jgi:beta-lactamase class A
VVCACTLIVVLAVERQSAASTAGSAVSGTGTVASATRSATPTPAALPDSSAAAPTSAAPSSAAPTTVVPTKSTVDADDLATAKSARIIESLPTGSVSVAATNLDTGQTYSFGATGGMVTASIVKLDLLEVQLLQHQRAGATLDADEDADAVAMIEHSDNSAAESVFEDIGGRDALDAANPDLGVSTTSTVPGQSDYWGLTTTSAQDQVVLLRNLAAAGSSPLSAAARSYALKLLRNVESDQAWGAPAAADPDTRVAVKNGWLGVDDDGEQSGITLVETLAGIAADAVS